MGIKTRSLINKKLPPINEDTKHRAKVVTRKRDIQKIKVDIDNHNLIKEVEQMYVPEFKGTHPGCTNTWSRDKRLAKQRQWESTKGMIWTSIGFMVAIFLLYLLILNVFDL